MNYKQTLLLTFIWMFFSVYGYTQITIGSDNKPATGSLLDIKENTNIGANALKGLGLPRVKLTNLKPANPTQLASSIGSTGSWSMAEHIGLLIYNINEDFCATPEPIYMGSHVWNGLEWEFLKDNRNPDVYTFTDPRDGESYTYRRFGESGIWMTQHMRAIIYSDGTPLDVHGGSSASNPTVKTYGYPGAAHPNWGVKPSAWKKEYGVFYNFPAATRDYAGFGASNQSQPDDSGIFGQYEVESDTSLPTDYRGRHIVQGICPDGWHVPSDREWNELEREIYENADKYSTYTTAEVASWNTTAPWDPAWVAKEEARPTANTVNAHGNAMKSICKVNTVVTKGKSRIAKEGGFDAPLVGHIYGTGTSSYGSHSFLTSSSIIAANTRRGRSIAAGSAEVLRNTVNKGNLMPVRCKKNDLNP